MHLYFHGVTAEDVAAITAEYNRAKARTGDSRRACALKEEPWSQRTVTSGATSASPGCIVNVQAGSPLGRGATVAPLAAEQS